MLFSNTFFFVLQALVICTPVPQSDADPTTTDIESASDSTPTNNLIVSGGVNVGGVVRVGGGVRVNGGGGVRVINGGGVRVRGGGGVIVQDRILRQDIIGGDVIVGGGGIFI